jgi:hypothetical protein
MQIMYTKPYIDVQGRTLRGGCRAAAPRIEIVREKNTEFVDMKSEVFLGLLSIRYQPLRSADEQKPSQFGK